ncbi:hypothetical protein Fot_19180 [Forsythia ovata]|uniref:Uncharacterized protein n=1 Tax=Forsythia ovata TaxID=205694 RepID=A0ABD1VKB0_9LAMI
MEVRTRDLDSLILRSESFSYVFEALCLRILAFRERLKYYCNELKKNPTYAPTPKVLQSNIALKAKSLPLTKGMVIRESSPNSRMPTTDKIAGKGKEKVVEPPPKVKPISMQVSSFSKAGQPRSLLREKRQSSDNRSSFAKKFTNGSFFQSSPC